MNLYAIVLGAIVVTLLGVSLARLGKVKTKADYLVAGRSLPAFVLVFTLLSSWIGSGWLLGRAAADLLYCAAGTQVCPVHHPRPSGKPLQPDRPRLGRDRDPADVH